MAGERLVVLYDEDCRWCRWSVARLVAFDRDRRLRLVPIQGEEGDRLLAGVPESERLESAHAVTPDGRVHSGGDAAAPIAAVLPSLSFGVPLLTALPGPTRAAYRLVADNRSRLGGRLNDEAIAKADRLIASRRD
ncbi:MAG: thiol-disulfide oxidoreductase DCC family protein [Solirubrobacterales bacterium]